MVLRSFEYKGEIVTTRINKMQSYFTRRNEPEVQTKKKIVSSIDIASNLEINHILISWNLLIRIYLHLYEIIRLLTTRP